ncbi:MAG: FAD-binding oxidoreductase [Steroidobacteraceae bacterium]
MRLPPGSSSEQFQAALGAFERVVGRDWLFTSDEDVALYRDPFSPFAGGPEDPLPSAALAPDTVEQVQEIVRIANHHRVPLYPISTGKNYGYGGPAPPLAGCVVLDLKRMNRVLEVDEQHASVLVEPGVSYFDLYAHLQRIGSKLWIDCPDPGWGSLVGNAIDRGGGYTMAQYRHHFDAHCGMEVVLPDGELLRTGMAALPGSGTWQQFKACCGPWVDGLFSQANFGIVTKMGFWLMPQPEAYLRCTVSVPRYRDLMPLVELQNHLEMTRIANGCPDMDSPLLGYPPTGQIQRMLENGPPQFDARHRALLAEAKLGYSPELEAYAVSKGIPYWRIWLSFYGPMEVIEAQWRAAQRHCAVIPGARFDVIDRVQLPITREQAANHREPEFGVPSLRTFSIGARSPFNPTPSTGHMWLTPIVPRTGEAIIEANRVFGEAAAELDLPLFRTFTLPTAFYERSFTFIVAIGLTADPETNRRYVEGFRRMIRIGADHGWGEYRTATYFQKQVMQTYSFNNHALMRFNERLKDALDPNGVIAPGRYDIWPQALRTPRP